MRIHAPGPAMAAAFALATLARAETPQPPTRELGVVTVRGGQPTSLPTHIPATMEGVTREQLERSVNATDSSDALKYLPSLLVRKRYAGDYNHAILSSRASGTGNSARSAVYADGILLSNFLGNGVGGLAFPPRWGLVTPEEIERVDVMYGPFSAAYPGNSVGAVVDYVTRMPTRLEGHAGAGSVVQPFRLYGTDETYSSWQSSASLGSKAGDWSWWFNVHRSDSQGQPQTFASRPVAAGAAGAAPAVTGAVPGHSPTGAPIYYVAAATRYHTVQDHAKLKLAYDMGPWRLAYVLGTWQNTSSGMPTSYLRDASGASVTSGAFSIGGRVYAPLTGADLPMTRENLAHVMHGLSLKSRTREHWDWEFSASRYDYTKDHKRQNAAANTLPSAATGGPGTLADGGGSGWSTLSAKGTWRPVGQGGAHAVDFGVQQERYALRYLTSAVPGNWLVDGPGSLVSEVGGRTSLRSIWLQDVWRLDPQWKAVLGGRAEHWTASAGRTRIPGATPAVDTAWPGRSENHLSPKAALAWQWQPQLLLKAAVGRAVRFPTAAELYGATSTANAQYINDPLLRPERSWTGELSAEQELAQGVLRATLFGEQTRDALYAQTTFDAVANRNVSRVQNVGRIATWGVEMAFNGTDVAMRGLDVAASVTFADSRIRENAGFASVPGDTVGKRQPNVPRWRASALASYRWNDAWTTSLGARFGSRQFRTLDNSDTNGATYMGVSKFIVLDLRAQWRVDKNVTASFGIDNLNNARYWNFHPYPQRSYVMELKADF